MSRLQKKCFVGATGFHLLLLVLLFVGPAFFIADKVEDAPILEFVPMIATDAKVSGGGTPAPRQPVQQPVQQQPVQPPVQPKQEPVRRPDPPKVETPKLTKEDPDSNEPKKTPKHQVKISDTVVKIKERSKPASDSKTSAQTSATTERAQQVASALKHIQSNLSSTTTVEMPEGPGGGGVSYANYGQIVRKIYTDAWRVPDDMDDDQATIVVTVTIARDGKVLSSRIVQPSSSAAANRSIQSTLDRISNIGVSFPAGAKESQRTFRMTFNLKATTSAG
jgi:outer membrane biosynthesis protein TonB